MQQVSLVKDFSTVFSGCGSNPLKNWAVSKNQTGRGRICTDNEIRGFVLEITSTNVATAYISTPKNPQKSLNIKWPFLVLQLKNLKRYFAFEVQILDSSGLRRRFHFANFQSKFKISTFSCQMPLYLSSGWNQIQLNLADYVRRAYGTNYVETVGIRIHANTRLRFIYFTPRLFQDKEKPMRFRMKIFPPRSNELKSSQESTNSTEHPSTPRHSKSSVEFLEDIPTY
ncbi:hypothetical protein DMENIID0001_100300 [Sergentomyia squamirostris]